jgi:transposase-like protein
MQNALHYAPKVSMRLEVTQDLRNVFNAPDRHEADRLLEQLVKRHAKDAPDLTTWMEASTPEGLAVFELPATHQRRLPTTNTLERPNQEL